MSRSPVVPMKKWLEIGREPGQVEAVAAKYGVSAYVVRSARRHYDGEKELKLWQEGQVKT